MNGRFKNLDWLAAVFYPLSVVLMEAFWVYPWLVWLGSFPAFSQPRPPLSLASIVIVLAVTTLGTRYFSRSKWPLPLLQAAIIGGGVIVILLVLGVEYRAGYGFLSAQWFVHIGQSFGNIFNHPDTIIFALPALLYLWWRGINLGQSTSYFKSIYSSFIIGMVALVVLIIIWQISSSTGKLQTPGTNIGFDIIAFFFFGLLSIAVTHLYQMRSVMPGEEAGLTSVWRWLPVMLVVIGGMVIVVFVIAGVFSEGFFTSIGHGFGVIAHFLGRIIDYVIIPFNYLFEGIVWVLRWLINLLRSNQLLQPGNSANTSSTDLFPNVTPAELPAMLYLVIKWLVIAVIAAAVIFILAKAISRFRARRAAEEIEEIHESLFSWRGLGDDLRELFDMMGQKFPRKKPSAPGHYFEDDETRRLDIREIYRHLLWEAANSGLPRSRHETPAEYSSRLGALVPGGREPLNQLTDMYADVRYGETSPPEEKVAGANGLWRTLRGLLRGIRGE